MGVGRIYGFQHRSEVRYAMVGVSFLPSKIVNGYMTILHQTKLANQLIG